MKKLICTPFYYDMPSWWPSIKSPVFGSYLGRKPASMATIRRFLVSNGAKGAKNIKLGTSFTSEWVCK